ncbi:transcriptional regulator, TetR family [Glycomyces sambucus]|uniref:Transcriptional regulator, TetR family n=1 Tax=Glycomyces sambucus TaxID=380244 RepID=A0A1G9K8D8_9ACTN|nr:helix-turn-helix domain-containing protein [Glycomyces sambucus]SDL46028.1 transcriptional regulator, TetR family [Glycomyces sambucus]
MGERRPPEEVPVSTTVQRLWRRRPAPRRGPKAALTLDRIVEAAIAIAGQGGLAGVSMARLAAALDVSPAALYRHIDGKDELHVLMCDAMAARLPDVPEGLDWRDGLEWWTRAQIELALAEPWMLDLPLASAPSGPHRIRWLDQALGAMSGLDLAPAVKLRITGLLAQHVLGEARVQIEIERVTAAAERADGDGGAAQGDAASPYAGFEALLAGFADPDDYPGLFSAFAGASAAGSGDEEAAHEAFGIAVLLDGIAAYIARSGGS